MHIGAYDRMATDTQTAEELVGARLTNWVRRYGVARKLAILLSIGAIASGVATYAALSGTPPFGPDPRSVLVLLLIDLVLLLSIGAIILRRLVRLWVARRRGSAGSRLHTRIVALFSIVAVAPAIVVAVFSALFFNLGVQAWFSERVKTALDASVQVAEAYVDEHRKLIVADARAMAIDVSRQGSLMVRNPSQFNDFISFQAGVRSIPEAIVFNGSGRILGRSRLSFALEFDGLPSGTLEKARSGEVVVLGGSNDDRVRALMRLDGLGDTFLYIGRFIDGNVLAHVERNRAAVAEYNRLEGERSDIEITFAMIFILVAVLLLMVAVWAGLFFANRLVRPISELVGAVEQVRAGDLSVRVDEGPADDEISTLSRAFNRMTNQLESQRSELVDANKQLDLRRRFTEAVLSGVSAGVLGLDPDGRINLPNRSATELLSVESEELIGEDLAVAVPEMEPLLRKASEKPYRLVEDQITIRRGDHPRRLLVRVTAEESRGELRGFVVTFDDISELEAAQRHAAWADVARRIAHEIKNPLTPIQLSAERLKRKYMDEITSDREVFAQCTDTIIRQVDDIKRMVDEFSNFARMPAPEFKDEDLATVVRQAQFLQRVAHPFITYGTEIPAHEVALHCDRRQIGQAVTNLLQNAADALEGQKDAQIELRVYKNEAEVVIVVEDNGCGLPSKIRDRLAEPYVTTRAKGTGLGLAIVKKIMEDHGGRLKLENRPEGGARASLVFYATQDTPAEDGTDKPLNEMVSHGA